LCILSIIDELTGLYNRRGFFNQAQQYMNANAQEGKSFYLIVADLDGMKTINIPMVIIWGIWL
jgi:two-component system, cell cycle response regulator